MDRTTLCVALFLAPLVACGDISPDDPSLVAGDYFPVEFVFQQDSCDLEDSIRALTDAKYTFKKGVNQEDQDSGSWNLGLLEAAEAGATDLWNLCESFPDIHCSWPATIAHLSRWQAAAEEGAGCSLDDNIGGNGEGLFLNEEELILEEDIHIRCDSESGSDDFCSTDFSIRLKR